MITRNIRKLINEIALNKGFTADFDGDLVSLNSGYMVSLEGFERRVNRDNLKELASVLIEVSSYISEGLYLGAWLNEEDDCIYVDVSVLKESREDAIQFGIKNKQKAIFDNKNKLVINL